MAQSEAAPVFVFKHSTSCPVSAAAHERVRAYIQQEGGAPDVRMVKVIETRPVSNLIAETLGVQHASPQIILVKGRKAVWHTSHSDITGAVMREALAAHG